MTPLQLFAFFRSFLLATVFMLPLTMTARAQNLVPGKITAASQDGSQCLYNDEHFHIQDFKAEGL